MAVAVRAVEHPGQRHRVLLVGDVHDRQGVLDVVDGGSDVLRVGVEADLPAAVVRVRYLVDHALGVMDVAVVLEAARERRVRRLVDVDHVQPAVARARADQVSEPGVLVDVQVVRVAVPADVVDRRGSEGHRLALHTAQLGEVEDLHLVVVVFRDDESVVVEDLDVAPERASLGRVRGQRADDVGTGWIADVDEHRAFAATDQCVVAAVTPVGPAPDVVDEAEAELLARDVAEHVDVVASELPGQAPLALRLGLADVVGRSRVLPGDLGELLGLVGPGGLCRLARSLSPPYDTATPTPAISRPIAIATTSRALMCRHLPRSKEQHGRCATETS